VDLARAAAGLAHVAFIRQADVDPALDHAGQIALPQVGLVVGGCAYSGYNKAIRFDESVKSSWAQVENVLQRRYDLIPNLVETVKGYAEHEKTIFTDIAESRTKYFQAGNQAEKVEAANGVERALSRLLMLKETYPDLKAQANFLQNFFHIPDLAGPGDHGEHYPGLAESAGP
jgi:hypothetical protein